MKNLTLKLIGITVTVALLSVGTATATSAATLPSAQPLVQPSASAAGAGCPGGTQTLVPDKQSLSTYGAAALVPQSMLKDQPTIAADATLQKMAALNATWLPSITCTILPGHSGVMDTSAVAPAAANTITTKSDNRHNWSGYEVDGIDYSKYSYYSAASMQWNAPAAVYPPPSTPVWDSIWPGIGSGGAPGNELIQAGSVSNAGPPFQWSGSQFQSYSGIEAWYELYPEENMVVIDQLKPKAGDQFWVSIIYDQKAETAHFNLCVASTCVAVTQPLELHSIADQVEYIVERPQLGDNWTELTPSGTLNISGAGGSRMETSGAVTDGFTLGATNGPPATNMTALTMTGCDNTSLAHPGPLGTTGQFQVVWDKLGTDEYCNPAP